MTCTGDAECQAQAHIHGCFAERSVARVTTQETAVALARDILDRWPEQVCTTLHLARLVLAEAEAEAPRCSCYREGWTAAMHQENPPMQGAPR